MSALEGLKVVEFGEGVALGYCGALLAACGAEVIKREQPVTRDMVRRRPPFAPTVESGLVWITSASKQPIALTAGMYLVFMTEIASSVTSDLVIIVTRL